MAVVRPGLSWRLGNYCHWHKVSPGEAVEALQPIRGQERLTTDQSEGRRGASEVRG